MQTPQNKQSKSNIAQQIQKEPSMNQIGTPTMGQIRKPSNQFDKVENGTPQSVQKEEKQPSQIQKMMQLQKGQNYKIGETLPICILKVRPLFIHETLISNKQMVDVLDRESLVFHSSTAEEESAKDFLMNLTRDKIYRAHRMIPQDQTNSALFNLEFPLVIDNLLKGISHAFLSVGAKESGKTHSLFGTLSDPGLLLYFAQSLFSKKQQSSSLVTIYLSVIKYDYDFYDVLCPTGENLLFKTSKVGSHMPCVTKVKIESLIEFFVYFRLALRSMPSRDINRDFSIGQSQQAKQERNHCIFRYEIFIQLLTMHNFKEGALFYKPKDKAFFYLQNFDQIQQIYGEITFYFSLQEQKKSQ